MLCCPAFVPTVTITSRASFVSSPSLLLPSHPMPLPDGSPPSPFSRILQFTLPLTSSVICVPPSSSLHRILRSVYAPCLFIILPSPRVSLRSFQSISFFIHPFAFASRCTRAYRVVSRHRAACHTPPHAFFNTVDQLPPSPLLTHPSQYPLPLSLALLPVPPPPSPVARACTYAPRSSGTNLYNCPQQFNTSTLVHFDCSQAGPRVHSRPQVHQIRVRNISSNEFSLSCLNSSYPHS
jgi:hypothetical protein